MSNDNKNFNPNPGQCLARAFEGLYLPSGCANRQMTVTLYQEDYNVIFHYDRKAGVIEFNSIDGKTDVESIYTPMILTKLEDKIRDEISLEKKYAEEYKAEMRSGEERGN